MKERFEVLDIFRGIFASLVVFFHLSAFSNTPIINNNFVYNCDIFVDFFFVLSGFVIAYNYQNIDNLLKLRSFYKKRFLRLYPLHLIVFLAFVLIEIPKHYVSGMVHVNKMVDGGDYFATSLSNIFLLNSVKLPGINDVSWNIASWSISAEMIAYLVFGLVIFSTNWNFISKFRKNIAVLIVFISVISLRLFTGGYSLMHSFDFGFCRGILGFFTGCVCFYTFDSLKLYLRTISKNMFTIAEFVLLTSILTLVFYGAIFKPYGYLFESLFFITILTFSFEQGWLSTYLKKSKFLQSTGKYSYSIYMVHTLVLSLFNVLFIRVLKFPPSAYLYLFIPNYILIYFIAKWTYRNIEMRFNQIPFKSKIPID
jgi:peptidoglycan/LPS O-acetylase OafA/YrhL